MSILPKEPSIFSLPVNGKRTKFCFVYCGPARCNCGVNDPDVSYYGESSEPQLPLEVVQECWCYTCHEGKIEPISRMPVTAMRMFVCSTCGNKRCPRATNHIYECTNSNEPGQFGSNY